MKHRFQILMWLRHRSWLSEAAAVLRARPAVAAAGALLLAVSLAAQTPAVMSGSNAAAGGVAADTTWRLAVVDGLVEAPAPGAAAVASTVAASAAAAKAEVALAALGQDVARISRESALRTAFQAYFSYRAAMPAGVRKPYLYFVDLGLDNGTARGWVFDMESLALVEGPFTVAHGRGSGPRNGTPQRFSNAAGSYASALGLYLAQETYTFMGKSGGRRYASVGLRLRGESGDFNGAARARGIVAHGAPYVTRREAGRSEGCPAMEPARANRLLPMIANGGVVFIYSPNDPRWLAGDPWIQASPPIAG